MFPAPRLTYVVPVHNEEAGLRAKVERLAARLAHHPGARIVLVENGSRDRSRELCDELAAAAPAGVPVLSLSVPAAGLGHAFHHAIRELARQGGDGTIVLTAADLPFGFSDLDRFLEWRPGAPDRAVAIGSKAHPRSKTGASLGRRALSAGFLAARRALVGMRTRDPQGSIFLPAGLAAELEADVAATDFFFSTEIVYLAERRGVPVVELPVDYPGGGRRSTVKPMRDGLRMLRQLWGLRARGRA